MKIQLPQTNNISTLCSHLLPRISTCDERYFGSRCSLIALNRRGLNVIREQSLIKDRGIRSRRIPNCRPSKSFQLSCTVWKLMNDARFPFFYKSRKLTDERRIFRLLFLRVSLADMKTVAAMTFKLCSKSFISWCRVVEWILLRASSRLLNPDSWTVIRTPLVFQTTYSGSPGYDISSGSDLTPLDSYLRRNP